MLKSILSLKDVATEMTEILMRCSEGRGRGRGWSFGNRGKHHGRAVFWRAFLVDGI